MFGSIARAQERPTSDIDFFVEVDSEAEKTRVGGALNAAAPRLALRFGYRISPLVLTRAQIRKPSTPSLIESILREGERMDRWRGVPVVSLPSTGRKRRSISGELLALCWR